MKIAIDESGDIGRRFWRGSTKWFVLAAAVVQDYNNACGPICSAISDYAKKHNGGAELHFAHNSHQQHQDFFRYISDQDFVFVGVAINKRKLLQIRPQVLATKQTLMRFCTDILFDELRPYLKNPTILIDTSGSEHVNRSIKNHIFELFNKKQDQRIIQELRYVDSRSEPLVQLADYLAGAIRHHVDPSYSGHSYEKYLRGKGKIIFLEDRLDSLPPKRHTFKNNRKKRRHKYSHRDPRYWRRRR